MYFIRGALPCFRRSRRRFSFLDLIFKVKLRHFCVGLIGWMYKDGCIDGRAKAEGCRLSLVSGDDIPSSKGGLGWAIFLCFSIFFFFI